MNEALVRYNAKRCEEAKEPRCTCACGGQLHGKAHSETWVQEQMAQVELELDDRRPAESDFV